MSENRKDMSRRDLLKSAGILGAGSILSGVAGALAADEVKPGAAPSPSQPTASAAGQPVARRPFGKTGVEVSILSLGGMFPIPRNQLMRLQPPLRATAHYAACAF